MRVLGRVVDVLCWLFERVTGVGLLPAYGKEARIWLTEAGWREASRRS